MSTDHATQSQPSRSEQAPTEASARSLGNEQQASARSLGNEQQPSARSLGEQDSNGSKSIGATPKLSKSEQARINGAKSKGPITMAGKSRSSMNSVKNATYADVNLNWLPIENGVLSGESRLLAFGLFEAALVQFQPQSALEITLVKKIVYHQCALDRLDRGEAAILQSHWNETVPNLNALFQKDHNQAPSRAVQTANTLIAMVTKDDASLRALSRLRRDQERSIANYTRRLKELRKSFPITESTGVVPFDLLHLYGLQKDENPPSPATPKPESEADTCTAADPQTEISTTENTTSENTTAQSHPQQAASRNEPNCESPQPEQIEPLSSNRPNSQKTGTPAESLDKAPLDKAA